MQKTSFNTHYLESFFFSFLNGQNFGFCLSLPLFKLACDDCDSLSLELSVDILVKFVSCCGATGIDTGRGSCLVLPQPMIELTFF